MKKEIIAVFSYRDIDLFFIKSSYIIKENVLKVFREYIENFRGSQRNWTQWEKVFNSEDWQDCGDEDLSSYGENQQMIGSYGPLEIRTEILYSFE